MQNSNQKYPIGIQHFHKLREDNFLYIDKTEFVYKIAEKGGAYFLSRPRRFGKSLFVSTLRALYEGRKDLFQGLFIEDKWDFSQTNPVVWIPFNALDYKEKPLRDVLMNFVLDQAKKVEISLEKDNLGEAFSEFIVKLHQKTGRKVVVLIDEYDKPIIDVLHDFEKADEHRAILKSFYGILKPADEHLQLVFLTGVSKFAKVSIFSDLNNLKDLTISENFGGITGITQEELESYFSEEIKIIAAKLKQSPAELLTEIKHWYNGYTWDLQTKVYNPWSLLNFFDGKTFKNFWFETGTPTFLVDLMREKGVFSIPEEPISEAILGSFEVRNLHPAALLFQTGYATLKSYDSLFHTYELCYPNEEVATSLKQYLLDAFSHNRNSSLPTVITLYKALHARNIDSIFAQINAIFATLPYQLWENGENKENFYHALVHLTFSLLGSYMKSEVCTSRGRCDALVETDKYLYAFEFKLDGDAKAALQQVFDKGYLEPYRNSGKELIALGVNFTTERKGVSEWIQG